MEIITIGPVYIRKWAEGVATELGWTLAKAYTKKQEDTNSRVWSSYDHVCMYPQRA